MCDKLRLNTTSGFGLERAKPDTAKVNGTNIRLPLKKHCNILEFQALADLFRAGATSRKKPRLNTTSGFG